MEMTLHQAKEICKANAWEIIDRARAGCKVCKRLLEAAHWFTRSGNSITQKELLSAVKRYVETKHSKGTNIDVEA